jgi:catechol 2,3-dioxygenase-like lactoylglutathione lyase family enzyme
MAKIKHIAIATQDPAKTARFYRDVFGLQEVGKVDNDNAEGYYLSDGDINLAILKFKNEDAVGDKFDTNYCGIHHIGFHVDDASVSDQKLRAADAVPLKKVNDAMNPGLAKGQGGRNTGLKYGGPDGVILDISQAGWVGTEQE